MEKLLKALQLTQEQYENIVFQQWFNWCGNNSFGDQELQSLTANAKLFNWWRQQYAVFESEFMDEVAPYQGQTKKEDAYLLYIKNVHKIQLYFSKPLITSAKKFNITVNPN